MKGKKMNISQLEKKAAKTDSKLSYNNALIDALGNPQEWDFTGEVIDSGKFSTAKCACGHSIRYQFIIKHNVTDETKVVGSTCVETIRHLNPEMVESIERKANEIQKAIRDRKASVKKAAQMKEVELWGEFQDEMKNYLLSLIDRKYKNACDCYNASWKRRNWYGQIKRLVKSYKEMDYVRPSAYLKSIQTNIRIMEKWNESISEKQW